MVLLRSFCGRICRDSSALRRSYAELGIITRLCQKKLEIQLPRKNYASYEGDGKTVAFVLNKSSATSLLVSHTGVEGFTIAGGSVLVGSLILFPHSVISWNVLNASSVTEESLTLFKILDPKIDILVFGYGNKEAYTTEVRLNFTATCKKLGLRFEALPTNQAIGLYNFLADEGRLVAAALIPPTFTSIFRERDKDLLNIDDEDDDQSLTEVKQDKLLK